MGGRRSFLSAQAHVTAERKLPAVLNVSRFSPGQFFVEKANGDRLAAIRLYGLVTLYYGYLHGLCVNDITRFNQESRTWDRCESRPVKTWCQYHGQSFGPSVRWADAARSEREYAKRLAAELS